MSDQPTRRLPDWDAEGDGQHPLRRETMPARAICRECGGPCECFEAVVQTPNGVRGLAIQDPQAERDLL